MNASNQSLSALPFKTRVFATVILSLIKVLSYTYTIRVTGNANSFNGLLDRTEPVVMACWHNRMFYFATYLYRFLLRHGFRLAMMSSNSKDGEIGATVGRKAGARVARGSSAKSDGTDKQGAAGLRTLYRMIVKEKRSIILLPDGSQGPVYKARVGTVALSQLTGAPVLPLSCWASSYWRIPSWDRMIIPKPFARIVIRVGEEMLIARKQTEESLEKQRLDLEETLDRLGRESETPFFNRKFFII